MNKVSKQTVLKNVSSLKFDLFHADSNDSLASEGHSMFSMMLRLVKTLPSSSGLTIWIL